MSLAFVFPWQGKGPKFGDVSPKERSKFIVEEGDGDGWMFHEFLRLLSYDHMTMIVLVQQH